MYDLTQTAFIKQVLINRRKDRFLVKKRSEISDGSDSLWLKLKNTDNNNGFEILDSHRTHLKCQTKWIRNLLNEYFIYKETNAKTKVSQIWYGNQGSL